ncbi:MAG: helix-turn-helix transcriptional regulator [Parashewanella sp.]
MEVDAKKIKQLRTNEGWTQQHLADVCEVSLRTVQRVERYGIASNETALGLCAAFNITVVEIKAKPPVHEVETTNDQLQESVRTKLSWLSLIMGVMIGSGSTFFITQFILR